MPNIVPNRCTPSTSAATGDHVITPSRIIHWEPGLAMDIGPAVCAIGAFDGVHLGHRFLIGSMNDDARRRGAHSVIVTFDIDPDELFADHIEVRKLLSNEDRIEKLSLLGSDYVLVLPFSRELAGHTFDTFLEEYLLSLMDLKCIHVGYDFKLGRSNAGDVGSMQEWGTTHGCECVGYSLKRINGHPVTATRIRELLAVGDTTNAFALLGRDHYVKGVVKHGRGAGGHDFGIPTANVECSVPYTPLKDGVYGGYVIVDGVRHPAAINVGYPLSFSDAKSNLEPHIVDFSGDLYGKTVSVVFVARLRDMVEFQDSEELVATVGANIEWVREHLS